MAKPKVDGRKFRWDAVRGVRDASTPLKGRITVNVPLLDDEEDHLKRLVQITGLKRYQVMRQALLTFTPEMADTGFKDARRVVAAFETKLALELSGGNRALAGSLLGISPSGVVGRIQKFGLQVKKNRPGRPSKEDRLQLRKVFNEQRAIRLLGRQQTGSGDSGASGGGQAAAQGQLPHDQG